ncbi:MAG: hypothetical protein KAR38_08520, partial [Calditrichia bacterium]|nr:hypothetical protein [Calditrichia bacterium]
NERILPQHVENEPQKIDRSFSKEEILLHINKHIDTDSFDFLKEKLLPGIPEWEKNLSFLLKINDNIAALNDVKKTIALLKKYYPNGNIPFIKNFDCKTKLSQKEIINLYIQIYTGIELRFPENFLKIDGKKKAAVIVRFLTEDILQTTPDKILEERDEFFFLRHKVQNIYRLFNYSKNRVLNNAYPETIMPWDKSRSENAYWESAENRKNAIRWLVEDRLNIDPEFLYKKELSKKDFAGNGLSYMFNQYYNSVARALQEAYSGLNPWELGKVSFSYWKNENAVNAIKWLIEKKEWKVEELPEKVVSKELNRKTFSQLGLATLFEKKFSKNIYRAISLAYPGRFEPWEFGKVSSQYWLTNQNIYHASKWVAQKEGFQENDLIPGIQKGELSFKTIQKYSIGRVLRKLSKGRIERLFTPVFWREQKAFLKEHKLQKKLNSLKNEERRKGILSLILNGFFTGEALFKDNMPSKRYEKIARRMKRRAAIYDKDI